MAHKGAIPEGMQINHKDENKANNCIDNLELMTNKENSSYGTRNARISKSMKRYRAKQRATHNIQLYKSKVYTDQRTGKDFDRPRYIMLKEEILESGDVLIVTELDRLGRNKEATLKELRFFKDNGIRVMVLELPTTLIDLSTMENSMARMMLETINNMMIELYASMAQAEIEKKEKRQREGIEQKKARGEWDDYGRPRVMDLEEFATHYRLVQQGEKKPFELMKELGMTKPTFYRYKNQIEKGC